MRRSFGGMLLWVVACAGNGSKEPLWIGEEVGAGDLPSDPAEDPVGLDSEVPEADTDVAAPIEPADLDADGVRDDRDNCPDLANADQADLDGDDLGDPCDDDTDGDFIPNQADLFPTDITRPGKASPDTVYAHGPSELYEFSVATQVVDYVGNFTFDAQGGSVTDIAIDRHGVLYAVTFFDAFVCHPQRAQCWHIGDLPSSYNGLSFVPSPIAGAPELLVGIANNGTWTAYEGVPFALNASPWGSYGGGLFSSGDVFHIAGVGTFGAVEGLAAGATIVETNTQGQIQRQLATLSVGGIYGLAGWDGVIYAFGSNGTVTAVDPLTGEATVVASGHGSWWGAGVRTILTP